MDRDAKKSAVALTWMVVVIGGEGRWWVVMVVVVTVVVLWVSMPLGEGKELLVAHGHMGRGVRAQFGRMEARPIIPPTTNMHHEHLPAPLWGHS